MDSSNPTLVDVARLIAEGKVADNYQFFIILIALGILAALVLWFVAPYLGERGKLLALAEKLQDRLDEIRQTTEVAENVRTRIAHSDWTVKEYRTLLRNKLEQLMTAAYKTKTASQADADFQHENANFKLVSNEPSVEMRLLSAMYFQKLKPEVDEFLVAHTNFAMWLIEARSKLRQANLLVIRERADLETLRLGPAGVINEALITIQEHKHREAQQQELSLRQTYVTEYQPLIMTLGDALQKLEARGSLLMKEYIEPATA